MLFEHIFNCVYVDYVQSRRSARKKKYRVRFECASLTYIIDTLNAH